MRLWFAKVRRGEKAGLIPTDEDSRALVNRLSDGECIQVEAMRPRSVQFNKMYWAICREIGKHQDPTRDEDSIDAELRILAGHYEVIHIGRKRMPWWFGPLARILEANGRLGTWLAKRLKTQLGHAHAVYVPKRIAFDKMDADEWNDYYKRAEIAIAERFGSEYVRELAA